MRHAMESKRKSNGGVGGGAEDLDDRSTKRRKTVIETDLSNGETVDTTTEYGLAFLEQIKTTKDKSGRAIATAFLSLPDKKALPDYYQITKLPIALDTIEVKLKKGDFPTLSALESYFKRMVQNAKEYNERGSQISDDAERIRKALSNYMTKHNPAYKTPGYVSQPTPIPTSASASASEVEAEEEEEPEPEAPRTSKKPRGRPPKNPQAFARAQSQRSSATPAVSETKYAGVSYSTLSFQQAQEKLVSDMITYKEDPEDEGAYWEVFVDLPPRSLKVYYQMIPNPMSLRKLQMRVTGNHGRNGSTGVSDYKTWAALEEDMSLIWNNAKHFNEDGSPIFNLALEFEPFFYKALREAKQAVPDPIAPKIKIKLPTAAEPTPSLKIKLGAKASPADSPAPQSNGTNGTPTIAARRNPFGNSSNAAQPPNLEQLDRARSMSGSAASPTPSAAAVVKKEDGARASPAIPLSAGPAQSAFRAPSQPVSTPTPNAPGMPPPSTTTPGLQSTISSSGYAQSFNHQSQYQPQNPVFDLKWRQPGKGAGDALITNLSLATHPGLNISRHFRMDLPPSPTMAQQSITINLPSTHYYLQIKPTIAPALLERQYKLFVTSGTQRLHAMPTIPGHSVDQHHPLFEARLLPGVNRIEVELIAALPKGAPKLNGQDAELEKITIYANLMR